MAGHLEAVTLADGPIELELLPDAGARLHRLRAFGHDLLRTPLDPSEHLRDPFRWGAYVMAPWCNRIAATATTVDHELVMLAPNFEDGTAIHGQVYAARWTPMPDGGFAIRGGDDGWPWPYECHLRVAVVDPIVTLELSLTNLAPTPMPAGLGLHPWLRRPLEVRIDAESGIASNLGPRAPIEPVVGPMDLRAMGPMTLDLDAAWLARGDPPVELQWPELGVRAALRVRAADDTWIVAASPSALDAAAVEPQTHAPWGLDRLLRGEPGSMRRIAPGATMRLVAEVALSRSRRVPAIASR